MKLPKGFKVSEADVQDAIIQRLELLGFTVMVTSRIRRKCHNCGYYPKGGDGVTKGLADLVVTHNTWPTGIAVLLEVKSPTTKLSEEQKQLEMHGRIWVVRDQDVAAEIMQAYHQRMVLIAGKI